MAKSGKRSFPGGGGGAGPHGKSARGGKGSASGRARLEEEARATFMGGVDEDDDEEVSSESEAEMMSGDDAASAGGDGRDKEETVEEARLRYAQQYLEEAREDERASRKKAGYHYDARRDVLDEADGGDSAESDLESEGEEAHRLGERLRQRREAEAANAFAQLASRLDALGFDGDAAAARSVRLGGHRGPPTCVAVCERSRSVLSGSKDNGVLQHDAETGQTLRTLVPRWPRLACEAIDGVGPGCFTAPSHLGGSRGRQSTTRVRRPRMVHRGETTPSKGSWLRTRERASRETPECGP